jgi:hypothetical protein
MSPNENHMFAICVPICNRFLLLGVKMKSVLLHEHNFFTDKFIVQIFGNNYNKSKPDPGGN